MEPPIDRPGLASHSAFVRVVMSATTLVFGVLGIATLFLPAEVAELMDMRGGPDFVLQLVGAGFLTVAILDWMGRGAIYGGVFGRPIVVANLMFGTVGSLSLLSALIRGEAQPGMWAVAAILGLHALAFAYLLKAPPYQERSPSQPTRGS